MTPHLILRESETQLSMDPSTHELRLTHRACRRRKELASGSRKKERLTGAREVYTRVYTFVCPFVSILYTTHLYPYFRKKSAFHIINSLSRIHYKWLACSNSVPTGGLYRR
jgi:hypothetical protein